MVDILNTLLTTKHPELMIMSEKMNGHVITNKTAPPSQAIEMASEQNVRDCTYGWGKIRPKSLKFLSSPVWFIVVFGVYSFIQGMAAWGLPNLVLPSIERRFAFSAKELGVIAASNDVAAVLFVVFISYYGDYGNKIRWMAGGAAVTGLGIIVFALPHFMIGRYHPGSLHSESLCYQGNDTMAQCVTKNSGGEWYYLAVFILAMLIMGVGSAPYFSLFTAYLDENIAPKSFPLYLGIWSIIQFMGPGIGYIVGGKLLSIYVDIKQPDGFKLTPKDPRWIGAWWIGFLIFGVFAVVCSFAMLGFPREMPGAKQRRLQHIREGDINPSNDVLHPSVKNIPFELKELLKNRTYLFNTLALTCLVFYAGTITVFFSKIVRVKFGIDAVTAGYFLAITSISATVLGNICGGLTVRTFSLKKALRKAAAMCAICHLLATGGSLIYLVPACKNSNLAGIAIRYNRPNFKGNVTSTVFGLLKSQCNKNCRCSLKNFSPVCGADNVTYLDACHAGCTSRLPDRTFANCSCIASQASPEGASAKPGYCDRDCKNLVIFSVVIILTSALRFTSLVPLRIVLLRSVPENKRAFATGVTYVTYKTLGLMPAPVILGHVVDESCRLWQNICGSRGRCFDYDVNTLSQKITYFGLTVSVFITFFFVLSWYYCKPTTTKANTAGITNEGADKVEPDETKF